MPCSTMRLRACHTFSALFLLPLASVAATPSNPVVRFDEAVARGLPQRIALTTHRQARSATSGALEITGVIDGADVTFSDGTTGIHYAGRFNDRPAVVTRSGDHLDITVTGEGAVDVTGYSVASESPHRFRHGTGVAPPRPSRRAAAIRNSRRLSRRCHW